jgi:shikimate dehydrogenase
MEAVDIIINTTSVGMAPDTGSSPLPGEFLAPHHTVFDIVYTPRDTALLVMAREKGCRLVYGSEMLLYQGARQFELWTGKEAPLEEMRLALEDGAGR